jgi:8-oxo-dGTP pyrophosphatase MutT (NUDIX family)
VRLALPAPIHRLALRIAHGIRLAWWGWRKPDIHGCNVVVRNRAGEVLLVRHSYQATGRWMLPGGGMARGESAEKTAVREVLEETGCRISGCKGFGFEVVDLRGAHNHIHIVAALTDDVPVADGREIVAARFFAADALPDAITSTARRRIARTLQNKAS